MLEDKAIKEEEKKKVKEGKFQQAHYPISPTVIQ